MVKDCMEQAQVLGMAGVWGIWGANQKLIRPFLFIRVIPVVDKLNGEGRGGFSHSGAKIGQA